MAISTSRRFYNQILWQHITLGHLHKILRKKLFSAKKVTTLPALTVVSGQAIDQYNKPLQFISSPNENLIQIYRDKVRYSQPPAYLIENGIMYLPGAPHIIFSNETDHWINRVTKRIISGLSAPSRSQI